MKKTVRAAESGALVQGGRGFGQGQAARKDRPTGETQPPTAHATARGSATGTPARHRTGATGTDTPKSGPAGPANRRTTTGKPHQPDQDPAKADAAAGEENPATTTTPENDRADRRNRQRRAPANNADPTTRRHGAAANGGNPPRSTTKEEEAATAHPHEAATPRPAHPAPPRAANGPQPAREGPRGQWPSGGRMPKPRRRGRIAPPALPAGRRGATCKDPRARQSQYQGFILDSVAETGSRRAGGDWRGARGNLDRSYPSRPWRWKV